MTDRLAREIADLKAQIDALDVKHAAEKDALQARLATLRALKQAWNPAVDDLLDKIGWMA